ncbi:MAG TPA: IS1595 family transposase [Candidatus Saccharimonadales bacterium]|nr:IS1595 family transposase [Candidatus Saccharimonadales bacterium]
MIKKFSLAEFLKKYNTDEACLEEIKNMVFPDGVTCPKCKKITTFYKITGRMSYSCGICRTQIYPLKGTIFEKSTTSLRTWFYVMFVMTKTRSGISARQIMREVGVTYKCAFRMCHQIRKLMADDGEPMNGILESDETYIGGHGKNKRYIPDFNLKPKEIVMGILQRGGKIHLRHIPNTGKWTMLKHIKENLTTDATIYTDQLRAYQQLAKYGYAHSSVNHKETYVIRGTDIHTNSIEGFWSIFKRGVTGVYTHISPKYLQDYANEYGFRYGNRQLEDSMFTELLRQIALKKALPLSVIAS